MAGAANGAAGRREGADAGGPSGDVGLLDLFEGRRQLIVRHFMFGPDWATLVVAARAPLEKLERYKAERGWTFPWYSSYGSDFNYDFHVTLDESVAPVEYNYRSKAEHERAGTGGYVEGEQPIEQPGESYFLRDGDAAFHTYSTYSRGAEATGGS